MGLQKFTVYAKKCGLLLNAKTPHIFALTLGETKKTEVPARKNWATSGKFFYRGAKGEIFWPPYSVEW